MVPLKKTKNFFSVNHVSARATIQVAKSNGAAKENKKLFSVNHVSARATIQVAK
jgi:hypothetical protein